MREAKVCYTTNTKTVEWHDMNTMQASVYAFYQTDYQKFFKKDEEKLEIPPAPYIPEDWKMDLCTSHNKE